MKLYERAQIVIPLEEFYKILEPVIEKEMNIQCKVTGYTPFYDGAANCQGIAISFQKLEGVVS